MKSSKSLILFLSFISVSSSVLSVPIVADKRLSTALAKVPLSQTEAHLKVAMPGLFKSVETGKTSEEKRVLARQNIENFLRNHSAFRYKAQDYLAADDSFLNTLIDLYLNEVENKGMYVFYHSTNVQMGWLYDIANEFRKQVGASAKKTAYQLRYEDKKFKDFPSVEAFYTHFDTKGFDLLNYRTVQNKKYTDYGLSANVSLFGSDGVSTSCSMHLFYATNSNSGMTRQEGLQRFAEHMGVALPFSKYDQLYHKYFWSMEGQPNPTLSSGYNTWSFTLRNCTMNNRMVQIFVHPSVINSMAYAAVAGGEKVIFKKDPMDLNGSFRLKQPLLKLRKDPLKFTNNLSTHSTIYDIKSLQARLYLSPYWVARPDLVRTKVVMRHPLKPEIKAAYRKELAAAIKEDLAATPKPAIKGVKKKLVITKKLQKQVKKFVKTQKKDTKKVTSKKK